MPSITEEAIKEEWETTFDEKFPGPAFQQLLLKHSVKHFIRKTLSQAKAQAFQAGVESCVNELESNPFGDNTQATLPYWIEAKQSQLRIKFLKQ